MKKGNLDKQTISRRSLLKTFVASGISQAILRSSPLISGVLFSRHAEAEGLDMPNKGLINQKNNLSF